MTQQENRIGCANKTARVVIEASGTSESAEAPTYAAFDVTHSFIGKLARLVAVCKAYELTEARFACYPAWGPGGIEEELRLQNGEVVVQPDGTFRFADYPSDGGYIIQTSSAQIAVLMEKFGAAADGDVFFLADDPSLPARYAEDYEPIADEPALA
ncbi:hypothetical protein SGO26_30030 (plasmid) [Cupriavidus metallidurans]|uniref:hypothetical protein n=1 Tax=Cupriavidus metallidurans TaxID=119219 RepID=UPI003D704289